MCPKSRPDGEAGGQNTTTALTVSLIRVNETWSTYLSLAFHLFTAIFKKKCKSNTTQVCFIYVFFHPYFISSLRFPPERPENKAGLNLSGAWHAGSCCNRIVPPVESITLQFGLLFVWTCSFVRRKRTYLNGFTYVRKGLMSFQKGSLWVKHKAHLLLSGLRLLRPCA